MQKKIAIGLLGLGTVGSGVVKVLSKFENIEIKKIAVKNLNKARTVKNLNPEILTDDPASIINDPEIKIVVEVIGGISPALELITQAIQNGKHIITANKELIAKHGKILFELAKKHNVVILYEAAVAGGIPIVMPIVQSLAGNKISKIAGILNGTTNYILTKMEEEGRDFQQVLKEAQTLGYAEADPTGDVEGYDAAYKIAILSSIAFNKRIDINEIYKEGINNISPEDIKHANEFGYKIKLIAMAQSDGDALDIRVHPMLVPKKHPLANINDVLNAIVVEGDAVGRVMFSGPGAGEFPTASSVAGDVLSIAGEIEKTGCPLPIMRCKHDDTNAKILDINETKNKYYINVQTENFPGVIGELGTICGKHGINLHGIIQQGVVKDNTASIVLLTESACEKDIRAAVKEISEKPTVKAVKNLIRVM
ncbi:MAG: homoserine dehydrogenase [bacterium]